jgi:hypothetical protein
MVLLTLKLSERGAVRDEKYSKGGRRCERQPLKLQGRESTSIASLGPTRAG